MRTAVGKVFLQTTVPNDQCAAPWAQCVRGGAMPQAGVMMSTDDNNKVAINRRSLLRAGAAAAIAAPIGAFGAQAFSLGGAKPAIDFSQFPICKASSNAPPIAGAPRKLKLS